MRTKNEIIKRREELYAQWERLPDEDEAEDDIQKWNIVAWHASISGQIDGLDWMLEYNFEEEEE